MNIMNEEFETSGNHPILPQCSTGRFPEGYNPL